MSSFFSFPPSTLSCSSVCAIEFLHDCRFSSPIPLFFLTLSALSSVSVHSNVLIHMKFFIIMKITFFVFIVLSPFSSVKAIFFFYLSGLSLLLKNRVNHVNPHPSFISPYFFFYNLFNLVIYCKLKKRWKCWQYRNCNLKDLLLYIPILIFQTDKTMLCVLSVSLESRKLNWIQVTENYGGYLY